MNIFLTLAFLFFIGATLGWVLELLFRRFSLRRTRSASGSIPASASDHICRCMAAVCAFST